MQYKKNVDNNGLFQKFFGKNEVFRKHMLKNGISKMFWNSNLFPRKYNTKIIMQKI